MTQKAERIVDHNHTRPLKPLGGYMSAYRAESMAANRATFIFRRRFSLGFSK